MNRLWYGSSALSVLLLPVSALFGVLVRLRLFLFRTGLLRRFRVQVPVVIVGNLTVGGTGKTPLTIWLVRALRNRGIRAGVVSRGYGGRVGAEPQSVDGNSDTAVVGDEPVLIARRADCPVVVHPDRVAAARALIARGVDLIVADDGLQHYRLRRDYEIAVVDAARGVGNGRLLPAGPLREPLSRLASVNRLIVNGEGGSSTLSQLAQRRVTRMRLRASRALRLTNDTSRSLTDFAGQTVHAVAGIGHPQRFFDLLTAAGIVVIEHPLDDHASIDPAMLCFGDDRAVLMTEKDAVKCAGMTLPDLWYVPVDADLSEAGWVDDIVGLVGSKASMA